MNPLTAFVSGLIFALGLGISGMTQPQKIIDFLNIGGDWDPSLMFVMGGALVVYTAGSRLATGRSAGPIFAPRFLIPTRRDINVRLIGGAALFGVGWGLAGYCPGPAIVSGPLARTKVLVFIGAMAAGMILFKLGDAMLSAAPVRRPAAGGDA